MSATSPVKSLPSSNSNTWRAPAYIGLWFIFSACTLFLNKYLLSYLGAQPDTLANLQLLSTTVCGFAQVYLPRWYYRSKGYPDVVPGRSASPTMADRYDSFFTDIGLLGIMRFGTVVLGLVSLKNVAVSFTETIKASAPLFTVFVAWGMLGEVSGVFVNLSLLPIMLGLILVSYTELSFELVGFLAALSNNVLDCVQNVFSKKLLSHKKAFTPPELQFFSSVAALVLQVPVWLLLRGVSLWQTRPTAWLVFCLLLDGIFFHLQSVVAYYVVFSISPVSHSVTNTVKRALLTVVSVIVFGNAITIITLIGTVMVIGGVFVYNEASRYEKNRAHLPHPSRDMESV